MYWLDEDGNLISFMNAVYPTLALQVACCPSVCLFSFSIFILKHEANSTELDTKHHG